MPRAARSAIWYSHQSDPSAQGDANTMGAPSPQSRQKSAVPSRDVMKVAAAGPGALVEAGPALRADRAVPPAVPAAAPANIDIPLVSTLRRFIHPHLRVEMGSEDE